MIDLQNELARSLACSVWQSLLPQSTSSSLPRSTLEPFHHCLQYEGTLSVCWALTGLPRVVRIRLNYSTNVHMTPERIASAARFVRCIPIYVPLRHPSLVRVLFPAFWHILTHTPLFAMLSQAPYFTPDPVKAGVWSLAFTSSFHSTFKRKCLSG